MSLEIIKWTGKFPPTQDQLHKMFEERELSYYSFMNSKSDYYNPHSHDYNKFLVMAKGEMKWIIDGKEYHFKQGDAIILPKGSVHEVTALSETECMEGHF